MRDCGQNAIIRNMKNRVIAVIPARGGSKGVPNKNIRFLNGKPMVAYAIETAKASRFITRTIVSTDSPEVKIIAQQLGVEVRDRDNSLCGDAVTLDAVIYDAKNRGDRPLPPSHFGGLAITPPSHFGGLAIETPSHFGEITHLRGYGIHKLPRSWTHGGFDFPQLRV